MGSSKIVFCLTLILVCSVWGFSRNRVAKRVAAAKDSAGTGAACPLPQKGANGKADEPLAIVAGEPIYEKDLTGRTAAQMLQIHQQEYQVESQALDEMVRKKVVEVEAKKRGISVEKLYEEEVDSKVSEPSDAEVEGYYLAVRSQLNQPFEAVKDRLRTAVRMLKIQEARQEYADSLRAKTEVSVLLKPPTVHVNEDPARVRGNPNAPITIVEFADFQCPFCGRVQATLKDLLTKYNGEVKLSYRDFPLSSIHPNAQIAAEASRCAEAQGKYWQMHDAMYANQSKLQEPDLIKTAGSLGMDEKSFASCLKSDKYKTAIQQDVQAGTRAGVSGTPAFFINGRFLTGALPQAEFEKIINEELAALKISRPTAASR